MFTCFYYWKFWTEVLLVTYKDFIKILRYVVTAIQSRCYSSTYPKDTLANYVS